MAGRRLGVDALVRSWVRSMRARNLTETTITHYTSSVDQLLDHARSRGHDPLTRVAIEEYLGTLARERKPATVSFRYRALQQFTKWLADEEELPADPMTKMRPPQVPEQPVPVLADDQMRALLGTCAKGKGFVDRRDHAIMRLFMDTGMRLAELAGLRVDDVDLDVHQVAHVTGKGRRDRAYPFGAKTAQALDRYLRVRSRHKLVDAPHLWLGGKNRPGMTPSGIRQMIGRRGLQAGVDGVHPHQFRHTLANEWLSEGGTEGDLMRLAGWRSRQMLQRYALASRLGASVLGQNHRFRDPIYRDAAELLRDRQAAAAVEVLRVQGAVSDHHATPVDAWSAMLDDWLKLRDGGAQVLMLATERTAVTQVNQLARSRLIARGDLPRRARTSEHPTTTAPSLSRLATTSSFAATIGSPSPTASRSRCATA